MNAGGTWKYAARRSRHAAALQPIDRINAPVPASHFKLTENTGEATPDRFQSREVRTSIKGSRHNNVTDILWKSLSSPFAPSVTAFADRILPQLVLYIRFLTSKHETTVWAKKEKEEVKEGNVTTYYTCIGKEAAQTTSRLMEEKQKFGRKKS
ncbi:hypothetical protein RvY_11042 [Ramazzottius varieornatus]|uniref:Uncharacterized protein n=1 Tax=Ramazzottius varieornatus TaxID=947166 RepID=A0A1D1VML6_RAMVA|nr:hypothetical protein RvY_11042 [Ramazzottius varieornatus]